MGETIREMVERKARERREASRVGEVPVFMPFAPSYIKSVSDWLDGQKESDIPDMSIWRALWSHELHGEKIERDLQGRLALLFVGCCQPVRRVESTKLFQRSTYGVRMLIGNLDSAKVFLFDFDPLVFSRKGSPAIWSLIAEQCKVEGEMRMTVRSEPLRYLRLQECFLEAWCEKHSHWQRARTELCRIQQNCLSAATQSIIGAI